MKKSKKRPPKLPEFNGFGEVSAWAICMNWFNGYRKFPPNMGETRSAVK